MQNVRILAPNRCLGTASHWCALALAACSSPQLHGGDRAVGRIALGSMENRRIVRSGALLPLTNSPATVRDMILPMR